MSSVDQDRRSGRYTETRPSNVRWSLQRGVFTTGVFPELSWDLYEFDPDEVDTSHPPQVMDFFRVIRQLGKGTFGSVYLVELVATGELLALKAMSKEKTPQSTRERELKAHITAGTCPFIIRFHSCFQTDSNCYILLQFLRGGNLYSVIRKYKGFDVPTARVLAAEIAEGLLYLHGFGLVHRDIKTNNILLGSDNHARIIDLGLCRKLGTDDAKIKLWGFAARYKPPEAIHKIPYGREVDWWGFGVCLYCMLTAKYPFPAQGEEELLRQIVEEEPNFSIIKDDDARDIIQRLLVKIPQQRLGYNPDTEDDDIRGHPFFKGIDWEKLRQQAERSSAAILQPRRMTTLLEKMKGGRGEGPWSDMSKVDTYKSVLTVVVATTVAAVGFILFL